ncbi:MAG: excinuclease ABC subunit UvrC [Methylophilaceae bacterium]
MQPLKDLVKTFPNLPGVYRMINTGGDIIYVGKAKNIKKRVASYFVKNQPSPRTRLMVGNIHAIEFTVTNTEAEALILENNLIKQYMPRYNVIFRDDKSYPYLAITADKYPRMRFHRGAQKKDSHYFGPFPNATAVRESIKLLQKVFMIRTCENSVFNNRSRPCLEYQIKRCTAPCVNLISKDEYASDVHQAALFLNGKDNLVIKNLTKTMNSFSEEFNYERAAVFRDRIQNLRQVRLKQSVSDFSINDADIIASYSSMGGVCVNVVMIRGGRHLGDKSFFPKHDPDQEDLNLTEIFITQFYDEKKPPPNIVIDQKIDKTLIQEFFDLKKYAKTKIISRLVGDKKAWHLMAKKNAKIALAQRNEQQSTQEERLDKLRQLLKLPDYVMRIECFDISHTMGDQTVASCVVYDDFNMQNKQYRRFNIKNNLPGDDYAAMREVLERRLKRIITEEVKRPDLILIDGGLGQVNAVKNIMDELGVHEIFMVGISKGPLRKAGQEKLILSDGKVIQETNPNHPGFHLIQKIRDEAHRFAITGHRAKRTKVRLTSRLEDIEGIGAKKRKNLLVYFGGLEGVKNAPVEELVMVDGIHQQLAEKIFDFFH